MITIQALKEISEIHKKYDTVVFMMSVSNLHSYGYSAFTEKNVMDTLKGIDEKEERTNDGTVYAITKSFEKAIVQCSYQLSKFEIWDLLLYIKKYVDIYDPTEQDEEL